MLIAPHPDNEQARLRLLRSLDLLDTPAEEVFDRITRVVAELLQVPMALVSLIDSDRQWFKSKLGVDACETSRDIAFCAHALHVEDMLVINDALDDARFADNPLVAGAPFVRFYAGVPLRSADGLALGTLCGIDTRPRALGPSAAAALKDLARTVERELLQREAAADARAAQEADRRALALSEARFATVFQKTPTGKAIVDMQGRFIEVNPKLCEITGYSAEELRQKSFPEISHPEDLKKDMQLAGELLLDRRTSFSLEKRYLRKDGTPIWAELGVALVRDLEGQPLHFVAVVQDISARKESEAILRHHQAELERRVQQRTAEVERSRETLQTITDNLPILIAQVDQDLRYQFNNEVYRSIFGLDPASLRGKPVQAMLYPALYQELLPYFQRALAGERVTHDNVRYNLQQDRIWSTSYIPDVRQGKVVGFYVMSQDVTERKRAEKIMYDKAMLDPLTELPNRRALLERLEELLAAARPDHGMTAVFFMDLDGFKAVNDRHGHEAGDMLLKQVAQRLGKTVRQQDFVSRLAGDEFVVIADGVPDGSACSRIADGICAALARPFALPDGIVGIGASIGIALCGAAHHSVASVLASADAAMYAAKRKGRNRHEFAPPLEADTVPALSGPA